MNALFYRAAALAALSSLTASGCAHSPDPSAPVTVSLQGGATPTCDDPLVSGFYDITVKAFADGPDKVNLSDYEQKTFAFLRSHAAKFGDNGDDLVDHVKDIPRQFIQIAKEDPKALDSCRNFNLALSGPA